MSEMTRVATAEQISLAEVERRLGAHVDLDDPDVDRTCIAGPSPALLRALKGFEEPPRTTDDGSLSSIRRVDPNRPPPEPPHDDELDEPPTLPISERWGRSPPPGPTPVVAFRPIAFAPAPEPPCSTVVLAPPVARHDAGPDVASPEPRPKRRSSESQSVGLALVDVFLAFAFFYWMMISFR
jgi:hypothetical protein